MQAHTETSDDTRAETSTVTRAEISDDTRAAIRAAIRAPLPRSVLRDFYDEQYQRMAARKTPAGACRLPFPSNDIKSAHVLDVQCRGAKGVCCLADKVGKHGFVWGVDASFQNIQYARSKAPAYLQRSHLPASMVHFSCAYPELLYEQCAEQLLHANAMPFNFVFASASLNVCYKLTCVLQQIRTVLAPGGVFVFDAVLCKTPLSSQQRVVARYEGDQFNAALTYEELEDKLLRCGFTHVEVSGREALSVPASVASAAGRAASMASASGQTTFSSGRKAPAPVWYRAVVQAFTTRS